MLTARRLLTLNHHPLFALACLLDEYTVWCIYLIYFVFILNITCINLCLKEIKKLESMHLSVYQVQFSLLQVKLLRIGKEASVKDAMVAMLEDHVHRVYVVDDVEEELPTPVAMITTSDMMEIIAKHTQL